MLPAGVDTKIPSPINFFIRFFYQFLNLKEVCLLCLSDNSLIAKNDFVLELIFLIFISNGLTVMILDFLYYLKDF